MKTICVCLDGSSFSNTAAEYALHLAEKTKSRLKAVHVLDSRLLEGPLFADLSGSVGAMPYTAEWSIFRELMEKKGESILKNFTTKAKEKGIEVCPLLLHGHPVRTLLDQTESDDLILFGQQGESAIQNDWLPGSTADRLIRGARCPALITPRSFSPITSILAAYDGTEPAGDALKEAARVSRVLDARLQVLSVINKTTCNQSSEIMEAGKDIVSAEKAEANFFLKEGSPENVIIEQAEACGCDLIALGLSKHNWLAEHLIGPLSLNLIHHSHLPVLLTH